MNKILGTWEYFNIFCEYLDNRSIIDLQRINKKTHEIFYKKLFHETKKKLLFSSSIVNFFSYENIDEKLIIFNCCKNGNIFPLNTILKKNSNEKKIKIENKHFFESIKNNYYEIAKILIEYHSPDLFDSRNIFFSEKKENIYQTKKYVSLCFKKIKDNGSYIHEYVKFVKFLLENTIFNEYLFEIITRKLILCDKIESIIDISKSYSFDENKNKIKIIFDPKILNPYIFNDCQHSNHEFRDSILTILFSSSNYIKEILIANILLLKRLNGYEQYRISVKKLKKIKNKLSDEAIKYKRIISEYPDSREGTYIRYGTNVIMFEQLFQIICLSKNTNFMKSILSLDKYMNLGTRGEKILLMAIDNKNYELFDLLLSYERNMNNPYYEEIENKYNYPREHKKNFCTTISMFAKDNFKEIAEYLCRIIYFKSTEMCSYQSEKISSNDAIKMLRILIDKRKKHVEIPSEYYLKCGHVDYIKINNSISYHDYEFAICVNNNFHELMNELMKHKKNVKQDKIQELLHRAITKNYSEQAYILINYLDSYSYENNYLLKLAVDKGCTEIVKILLTKKDVDIKSECDYALRRAKYFGYTEIVKMLEEKY